MQGHGENAHKVVVSLCDYSGNWPRPWNDQGCTVLHYDLKHGDDVLALTADDVWLDVCDVLGHPLNDDFRQCPHRIVCVLAAPPCTDFTVSGARWWPAKDADGRTAASLAVLDACVELARELSPDCYAIENPVGRLGTLRPGIGKPLYYFDPCDYALNADDPASEAYTKRTGMWGVHRNPALDGCAPVEPVMYERGGKRGSWMWAKLGGKSERTKELRSMTPTGFARAFCAANMR
jgi:hypothetical protein